MDFGVLFVLLLSDSDGKFSEQFKAYSSLKKDRTFKLNKC